jgi:REP element-mobilizing transposase RayT
MVVAVELRGKYQRPIWNGPRDQFEALHWIACEALIAFCLMSTHFHLVLEVPDERTAERVVRRIARRLDATADERGVARLDVPHMQVLADDHAVLRYVAYTHANPVKAGMVSDPLAWAFSSHRDVYGLRHAAWFSPAAIHARLSGPEDASWLHRKAEGRIAPPVLVEPTPREWPIEGLAFIERTVASVYGLSEEEMDAPRQGAQARACLATVARIEGWRPPEIADFIGWTDRHARRFAVDDTPAVRAALAILRDPRLRPSGSAWWEVPVDARGPSLWQEWRESVRHDRPIGHDRKNSGSGAR